MPNIEDYLIDQAEKDWAELLSDWVPPLAESFTMFLVNRLGDIFVILDDGSVHMLDVGAGTFTRLADDRDDFAAKNRLRRQCRELVDDISGGWL